MLFDLLQHLVGHQRSGAVSAHSAGVGALVAIVGGLVVLRGRQRDDGLTVGDRQHAGFRANQFLFNDQLIPCLAEFAIVTDPLNGFECLIACRAHDDTFASGQSVGFDDDRYVTFHFIAFHQVSAGAGGVAEHLIIGSGDIGAAEQILAEDLAGFELCGAFGGAEDVQIGVHKRIHNARGQRRLGSHDGQADIVLAGELDQLWEISAGNINVLRILCRARVTGGDENAVSKRALRKFPRQRMLSSAGANHQNIHETTPNSRLLEHKRALILDACYCEAKPARVFAYSHREKNVMHTSQRGS